MKANNFSSHIQTETKYLLPFVSFYLLLYQSRWSQVNLTFPITEIVTIFPTSARIWFEFKLRLEVLNGYFQRKSSGFHLVLFFIKVYMRPILLLLFIIPYP